MSDDEIKFTCAECGKQFAPDPDSMVELNWSPEPAPENLPDDAITPEQLENMLPDQLAELGLTPEDREKMLRGEEVTTGGICICVECQDRLAAEQGKAP